MTNGVRFPERLRSGIFTAPFLPRHMDPTLAIRREMELIQHLDRLGYDEAWIGEHHSGGTELIDSPELFIAGVAERTERIRLGTGVISLPYHNPLMVAARMMQLDHQTRGRAMFGFGPGLLVGDARMLGIAPPTQRDRMVEALEIILRLIDGEVVTHESDWLSLHEARLQLSPYTRPRPHIAVASAITPSGGKTAGRFGLGMLCLAAASGPGYDVLDTNWALAEKVAAEHGRTMDRRDLRLVAPFHLAETRQQAVDNVRQGFAEWADYSSHVSTAGPASLGMPSIEAIIETGNGAIGTPDDAVAALEKFWANSGGCGCMLHLAHHWADFEATKRSYALFAEYVLPKFENRNASRMASLDWMGAHVQEFSGAMMDAADRAIRKHFGT